MKSSRRQYPISSIAVAAVAVMASDVYRYPIAFPCENEDIYILSSIPTPSWCGFRLPAAAQRCVMAKMASVLKRNVLPPEIDPNAEQVMVYKDGVVEVDDYEVLSDGSVRVPAAKASGISAGTVVGHKDDFGYVCW